MSINKSYTTLTPKALSEFRQKIDPKAYQRSLSIVLFWCFLDITLYILFLSGVFAAHHGILKFIFGLLAGISASAMFVLAHDAAHGSLFKNKWVAEIMGTLYMLPALNSYRLWCFGHNRIHHGFTSYTPIDWIWRPLTKDEYEQLTTVKKWIYRSERSLWGSGLHYILKIWWEKMVLFMPDDLSASKKRAIILGKGIVALFALVLGTAAYINNGFWGIFCALILPFVVFNYVISLVIYIHHTHPDIPFFDERKEWSHTVGAIFCTSVVYTHWFIDNFLIHHILIHTPHHVDIRIPFYRLKTAYNSVKPYYADYIHEYRLNWSGLYQIFKSCKLYDYKKHIWSTFE